MDLGCSSPPTHPRRAPRAQAFACRRAHSKQGEVGESGRQVLDAPADRSRHSYGREAGGKPGGPSIV